MDADRFDSWTRALRSRRTALVGLAGGLAALTGWLAPEVVTAKPPTKCGKGEKRCGRRCIGKSGCCTKRDCPEGATCVRGACRCPAGESPCGRRCARPEGAPCAGLPLDVCCSQSCDYLVDGGTCSPCRGQQCQSNDHCCPELPCSQGFCGGCRHRAVVCTPGGQACCFSDCTSQGGTHVCLSPEGGRCARDSDCATCYFGDGCSGACIGGVCQF